MLQLLYAQQRKNTRKRKTQKRRFSYCYSLIGSLRARVHYASLTCCVQNFQICLRNLESSAIHVHQATFSCAHDSATCNTSFICKYTRQQVCSHTSRSSKNTIFYFFGFSACLSPPERNTSSISTHRSNHVTSSELNVQPNNLPISRSSPQLNVSQVGFPKMHEQVASCIIPYTKQQKEALCHSRNYI